MMEPLAKLVRRDRKVKLVFRVLREMMVHLVLLVLLEAKESLVSEEPLV